MEEMTIERLFEVARSAGLCYNQAQFAQLLGVDRSVISNAFKKGASERLLLKAEKMLASYNITINGNNNGIVQTGDNATATPQQPSEIERLIDELAAQRETYAQQIKELQERLKQSQQTTDKLVNIITMSKQ